MVNASTKLHLDEPALEHARTDFVRVRVNQTVGEALAQVRETQNLPNGRIVYFYALDDDGRLQGVVPTRRLLLSKPETPVSEIMESTVVALPATASLLDACEFFILHRLLALPVVDDEGRVLGVADVELYTDEMSQLAQKDEYNDIFQLIGVRLARLEHASVHSAFRRRFPWLLCNITGGLAAALLAGFFQDILDHVIVLALFIPVVLALAESVGIQSLTMTLQFQHGKGRLLWREVLPDLAREAPVGALLGLACASLVALAAWISHVQPVVAICILLSIVISIVTATLLGTLVPTLLRSVQRDPKLASGPITLALIDLATLLCYLGIATIVLR
jgi:magnesium transporter